MLIAICACNTKKLVESIDDMEKLENNKRDFINSDTFFIRQALKSLIKDLIPLIISIITPSTVKNSAIYCSINVNEYILFNLNFFYN